MSEVVFDGGTIATEPSEVVCTLPSGARAWRVALPAPEDSYFYPIHAAPTLLAGSLYVQTVGSHCKDDSSGYVQLHRILAGGKLAWSVTPDRRDEGMIVLPTTTGLLVVAPWELEPAVGEPSPLVARLLDPETAAIRAEQRIDLKRRVSSSKTRHVLTLAPAMRRERAIQLRTHWDLGDVHLWFAACTDEPDRLARFDELLSTAFGAPL